MRWSSSELCIRENGEKTDSPFRQRIENDRQNGWIAAGEVGHDSREQILHAYRAVRDALFRHIKARFQLEGMPSV